MENQNTSQKFVGRSKAREEAFKLLFQSGSHKDDMDELFEYFFLENPDMLAAMDYIRGSVLGAFDKSGEIDKLISDNLKKGWKISRLSKVSLYILRLAVYEMIYVDDVPAKVAINEAVELAKKYSDPKNASFVNGILSGVYKQINER